MSGIPKILWYNTSYRLVLPNWEQFLHNDVRVQITHAVNCLFSECYHPMRNGVVVSVSSFARVLTDMGHQVTIFTARHPEQDEQEENVYRFPSVTFPVKMRYPLALPIATGKARRMLAEQHFDLIHSHSPMLIGARSGCLPSSPQYPAGLHLPHPHRRLYTLHPAATALGAPARYSLEPGIFQRRGSYHYPDRGGG